MSHEPHLSKSRLQSRTSVARRLTLSGWRFRASCVCGRSMVFFMDRANRDAWVKHHEDGSWCDEH